MLHSEMENIDPQMLKKLAAYLGATGSGGNYILPNELNSELQNGKKYFLLDTRAPEVYAQGHIDGANNIFWLDILKPENVKKLPRDQQIIILCNVGHSASQVLVLLRLLGFDARALKFGMSGADPAGWISCGFETVTGK